MSKIRPIQNPPREGTHVTLSDARAAFRDLNEDAKKGFPLPGKLVFVKKARTGRNPVTGKSIGIPVKKVLKFRIAKAPKDTILGKK